MLVPLIPSPWTDLVDSAALASRLGLTGAAATNLAADVTRASRAIADAIGYPLLRAQWREGVKGYWLGKLVLTAVPVKGVPVVALMTDPSTEFDSDDLTPSSEDVYVEDSEAGIIRGGLIGFHSTREIAIDIEPLPLPFSERPLWRAEYWGGWIPPAGRITSTAIAAVAETSSFNRVSGAFPSWIKPGDRITSTGFANSANNGVFSVVSVTSTVIVVRGASVIEDEGAGESVTLDFRDLPADLEQAAASLARFFYYSSRRDSSVASKKVGDFSITFRAPGSGGDARGTNSGIGVAYPTDVAAVIARYMRVK